MLTYKRSNHLEVIGYSDLDYAGCADSKRYTFDYMFLFARGAFHGKVESSLSFLLPLWRLNLWYALKALFMHCGCGILSLV